MTPGLARLNSKGGRPAILALVLAIQLFATLFFVLDAVQEAIADGLSILNGWKVW